MGKAEKSDTDICCPLKMKTGISQISQKYVKKWGMRGEVEKETPKKWIIEYFYDVTHDTFQRIGLSYYYHINIMRKIYSLVKKS